MSGGQAQKPWSYERSWSYVLWLLGRRSYSSGELTKKLAGKGVEETTIRRVLARLEELHLIDDSAFARAYVRARAGERGHHALRRELLHKGLDEDRIDAALEPALANQVAAATGLLEKHAWRFRSGDARKDRAKAYAFLSRRGIPADAVRSALESRDFALTAEEPFD